MTSPMKSEPVLIVGAVVAVGQAVYSYMTTKSIDMVLVNAALVAVGAALQRWSVYSAASHNKLVQEAVAAAIAATQTGRHAGAPAVETPPTP